MAMAMARNGMVVVMTAAIGYRSLLNQACEYLYCIVRVHIDCKK